MGDWFEDLFGQSEREDAARAAMQGRLGSAQFFGHGGNNARVAVRPDGSVGVDSDLGDMAPLRQALMGLFSGNLSQQGLPKEFLGAAATASNALGPVNAGASGSFGFANQLMQSGLFRGLQKQLEGGAGTAIHQANQGFDAAAADRLSLLREQAAPHEQRAFTGLQDTLFAQGRAGSTGGALQTEAFARGLAEADLGRQLAAQDLGRGLQSDATARAGAFGSQLAGLRGLEDSLVNSGFGRGLQMAGLNTDRAISRFGVAGNVLDSRLRSDATRQGLGLEALRGIQGMDEMGLQHIQAALNAAIARSNSQLGVGSNLASVAGSAGGFGRSLFGLLGGL